MERAPEDAPTPGSRKARRRANRMARDDDARMNQERGRGAQTENRDQTEPIEPPTPTETERAETLEGAETPPSNVPRPSEQQLGQPLRPRAPPVYRAWGQKLDPKHLRPGAIISLPYHYPNIEYEDAKVRRPGRADRCKTLTYIGAWVCSKFRKVIIVHRYPLHCVAVPIFTHGGRGLSSKEDKDEWRGVRDLEDTENEGITESPHKNITIVRTDEYSETDKNSFHSWNPPTCYAHFTAPIDVDINVPAILDGNIENEAHLKRLLDLHCQSCSRCPEKSEHPEQELQRSSAMSELELSFEEDSKEAGSVPPEEQARAQFLANDPQLVPDQVIVVNDQTLYDAQMAQAARMDFAARTLEEANARRAQAHEAQMAQRAQIQAEQAQMQAQQAQMAQQAPYGPPGIVQWGAPVPVAPPGVVPFGAPVPVG